MKVLVADDDDISRRLLAETIRRRAQLEVVTVDNGRDALDLCLGNDPPDVAVLDWEMPGLTGPEVCREIRQAEGGAQPYLLLVTVRSGRRDVVEGLASGADDMLSKPVPPDLLLARLSLGTRRTLSGAPRSGSSLRLLPALRSAVEERDGELLVRDGDVAARVYYCHGRIGWIHIAQEPGSLVDVLSPEANIDAKTARSVAEECRRTGDPYGEVLVRRGLLERAQLRTCLQDWMRRRLQRLLTLRSPQTLFIPQRRACAEDMIFELEELLGDAAPDDDRPSTEAPSIQPPSTDAEEPYVLAEQRTPAVDAALDRCMRCTGLSAVVAVHQVTGVCLAQRGSAPDSDIVWASVRHLRAGSGEGPESSVLTTEQHYYFTCLLPAYESAVVCARFDRRMTSLGAAWSELRSSLRWGSSSS